ncbi:MAG: LysM peptidoglycan-binding domain-containing protein [Betaproteobacteria bacterium]|nr:LysM peptidoglycan-binding domain-containing protein [Betaproteobacteria bacterium]
MRLASVQPAAAARSAAPARAVTLAPIVILVLLAGCAQRGAVPVIDRTAPGGRPSTAPATVPAAPSARGIDSATEFYTVRRGDTLYSIALDTGNSYREVAEWNGIANPNLIREGQVLRLTPPQGAVMQVQPMEGRGSVPERPLEANGQGSGQPAGRGAVKSEPRAQKLPYSEENYALLMREPKPAAQPPKPPAAVPAKPVAPEQKPVAEAKPPATQPSSSEADDDKIEWGWPTAGRVIAGFSESSNKGLDISGKSGQPVVASASGTVLYVGSGIRGYGKLIVVRHSRAYSTVYAHNSEILVKEGQRVLRGQKIAEMGNTDADQVKLHFEIRRLGKPTDPNKYLPERSS